MENAFWKKLQYYYIVLKKKTFYKNFGANDVITERPVIYIHDVIKWVQKRKKVKLLAGPDGLTSKSIMYGTNKLFMYITLFFNVSEFFILAALKCV